MSALPPARRSVLSSTFNDRASCFNSEKRSRCFFSIVGNWTNYFLPFVTVPGRGTPVQVGIAQLLSNVPQFNPTNSASTTISLPTLALGTLISVAPVLIIFLFSQRFLVTGMTAGGTKE